MQNRGAIATFAIILALASLFQLSFTFFTRNVERNSKKYATSEQAVSIARKLAKGDVLRENFVMDSVTKVRERHYLDSMSNEVVYNILLKKYTYQDCKEREVNLGLDLKGGMNVMMEVSVEDIIRGLSGKSQDPTFTKAMDMAKLKQRNSQRDFVDLFKESFEEVDPNARLAAIFAYEFKNQGITTTSTNDEVIKVIRDEAERYIDQSYQILRTRIDRFGVAQPNIQRMAQQSRILIELPGIKEPERIRKLLQGTASLEFWETYSFAELAPYFSEANQRLRDIEMSESGQPVTSDTTGTADTLSTLQDQSITPSSSDTNQLASDSTALEDLIAADSAKEAANKEDQTREEWAKENPLFNYLSPAFYQQDGKMYASDGASVGYAAIKDTAMVNRMLRLTEDVFPRDLKLAWSAKPERWQTDDLLTLFALRITTRDGSAPLGGDAITNAFQDYDQNGQVEVSMSMDAEGGRVWKRLTGENIGKQVAIVLDDYVRSAPNVKSEIPNGQSSISGGGMEVEEAQDIANILKAGKMPAPARIVQEEVVGPSLGREAIRAGVYSFFIAFLLVLIYMFLYYNRAGLIADVALVTNIFFIFGILASLGATLTLPGIAGIVLTLGMAVDANVIIYERVREEVRAGKGMRLAISDGYKMAYSAIIDGNVTTLITGVILYIFGSGPIQGFATTLIIGILTSLFSAIFISRIIFTIMLDRNKRITFANKYTLNTFTNLHFDFVGSRRIFYIVSAIVIVLGTSSLIIRGLDPGVDFSGGRTYVVRFDQDVRTSDIRTSLEKVLGSAPEVKTFGPTTQVKITTNYLIDDISTTGDSVVEASIYKGVQGFFRNPIDYQTFSEDAEDKIVGKLSSQMVGPTIADDLKVKAVWAVFFALVGIFIYIAIRFKKWQFGLGGVAALAHDGFIMIALYSMFYNILPFAMEVDQAFIAAVLTIIGYSINDSVIIYDRVREYLSLYPKRDLKDNMNAAVNSTIGRTVNTAGTTLVVLIAMFIFGGEVIRGFTFALGVGIVVGTYSSVFISVPVAYELAVLKRKRKKAAELKPVKA
ncbi:MAG TPA: protein translocase subunit SecDF [Bacteroidales bacterium]|nr:protein translocase subunit SecDF [Bacteroidales bacterium]